jgi:hypothetical protein
MLWYHGHKDIIAGLSELAKNGQIEFTGSGKYHPILPLIPIGEIERQIRLNRVTNSNLLGKFYQPLGLFPPEMCYAREIVAPVLDSGYQWIILSGIACPVEWPVDKVHYIEDKGRKLKVFFRDDIWSNKISFKQVDAVEFVEALGQLRKTKKNIYVVTAMDAETYGHHVRGWEKLFLAEVYEELQPTQKAFSGLKQAAVLAEQHNHLLKDSLVTETIQMVNVSELLRLIPDGTAIEPKASSWSTTNEDIAAGNPFPLWKDKNNEIHRLQWEHLKICIELVDRATKVSDNEESREFATIARGLLDRALHSCQFWWASRKPMWDINLIHTGLIEQWRVIVNAFRAINCSGVSEETKRECYYRAVAARDIRNKITDRLFLW